VPERLRPAGGVCRQREEEYPRRFPCGGRQRRAANQQPDSHLGGGKIKSADGKTRTDVDQVYNRRVVAGNEELKDQAHRIGEGRAERGVGAKSWMHAEPERHQLGKRGHHYQRAGYAGQTAWLEANQRNGKQEEHAVVGKDYVHVA
jgi:hypothetical protein